jgi:hypothetical protein
VKDEVIANHLLPNDDKRLAFVWKEVEADIEGERQERLSNALVRRPAARQADLLLQDGISTKMHKP